MENLKAVIEALIFVSEVPLSVARIREIVGECEKSEIITAIDELVRDYEERGGLQIQEVAGGYQIRTNPNLNAWIKKLRGGKPMALSQPAMETLAIIAYRQPVVKADIEKIRGVDVSGPLKGLLEKKLVRMVGRKDVPGKPILYGTSKKFLEVFNLSALSELPSLRELRELQPAEASPEQTSLESLVENDSPAGEAPADLPAEPPEPADPLEPAEPSVSALESIPEEGDPPASCPELPHKEGDPVLSSPQTQAEGEPDEGEP